jgi:hypothetical protein
MIKHTADSLRKYSADELRTLRANALRLGAPEVVSLCDFELQRRKPPTKPPPRTISGTAARGRPVRGFHFVCPAELGVTFNPDGTFCTGIWVVAAVVTERALSVAAYVALHNAKSERSYLQGTMKGWRQLERKGKAIPYGIEFVVEPTNTALPWRGDSTGERGYYYGEDQ